MSAFFILCCLLLSQQCLCLWQDKVDPKVLLAFETTHEDDRTPDDDHTTEVSYLILFEDAKINTQHVIPKHRPQYVYDTLTAWTAKTQKKMKNLLQKSNVSFKSYWVANVIAISSNISVLADIAMMDEVKKIEPNNEFRVPLETEVENFTEHKIVHEKRQTQNVEWNVDWVGAPTVWTTYGYRGDGFVVANADTGVAWQHPALIRQYRGFEGDEVKHDYNWWDAIHSGGNNRCGLDSGQPCDDNGHGTHTTGTAVGFDHAGYYIGVAPGAKWIACRNMNAGLGTPQRYIECLQFFVAPTDLSGNGPQPSLAPHVIGNSYGCPPSEGCAVDSLAQAVTNVVQAGIFMSVSAGNAGPSCESVEDPPAIYDNVCAVGATGLRSNTIASYSSRGPVTVDGSGISSPNVVAPGSSVRSAYPPSGYATLSGTSMASPAVTGSIPLLWQAYPELARQPLETRSLLERSATKLTSNTCQSTGTPNNVYGHGLIDLEAALSGDF